MRQVPFCFTTLTNLPLSSVLTGRERKRRLLGRLTSITCNTKPRDPHRDGILTSRRGQVMMTHPVYKSEFPSDDVSGERTSIVFVNYSRNCKVLQIRQKMYRIRKIE